MKKVILKIGGMSCSGCSSGLEKNLNKQEGIIHATVNLVLAQAVIEYEDTLTITDLEKMIRDAGFESLGIFQENKIEENQKENKRNLLFFTVLTLFVLYLSMAHMLKLPAFPFLDLKKYPMNYTICLFFLTILFLVYGRDILISGLKNLLHKTPNMDTLVMLGVSANLIYSIWNMILLFLGKSSSDHIYFESCCIILFFIKVGRFIDHKNKEKTKEALKELVQITPTTALLKQGQEEKEVTIDEIKKKDILICKPGMKVAVDGIIVSGEAHIEESFLTGESTPIKKKENDQVIAGSMNIDGYIEYQAEKIGKDSTISEIVRLVVEATSTKAPIQRIADVVSSYFVPVIILIAFMTFVSYLCLGFSLPEAITALVSVLVVACPCALGLATPLAIVVSEGTAARKKILIKQSETLENAQKIDTIIFDKTGTLTYGNLKLSKIYHSQKYTESEFMQIVTSMEQKSNHPIAKAFQDYAFEKKLSASQVTNFQILEGIGLKGKIANQEFCLGNAKLFQKVKTKNPYTKEEQKLVAAGNSIVYVIENQEVIGLIGVKDIVRENAKITIERLKKMGKYVMMLTGDHEITANIIAKEIGIDHVVANVIPQEKTKIIRELLAQKHHVMMVGDGINDAPSLATSSIGVSIHSGTDIAIDSADVILMQDNLERILDFLVISKKTLRIIKENLFWAFFYNICMIPLAMGLGKPFGLSINPMIASFSMTISSLTVVLNSLRLNSKKKNRKKR